MNSPASRESARAKSRSSCWDGPAIPLLSGMRGNATIRRVPSRAKRRSERVLQSELQLAHGDAKSQAVDDTETLVGRSSRRARKGLTCQNVPIRSSQVGVIQQ